MVHFSRMAVAGEMISVAHTTPKINRKTNVIRLLCSLTEKAETIHTDDSV